MSDPDEVVKVEKEVPSAAISEAVARHEQAETDDATPQEKKQAAVEQAHALSTRPQGSYAQLHETEKATLAVPSEERTKEIEEQVKADEEADKAVQKAAAKAAGKDGGPVAETPVVAKAQASKSDASGAATSK